MITHEIIPCDPHEMIDGQPFDNGLCAHEGDGIREVVEDHLEGGYPEAIYLFADSRLTPLAGNLEAWPLLVATEEGWYSFQLEADGRRTSARARVLQLQNDLVLPPPGMAPIKPIGMLDSSMHMPCKRDWPL